VKSINLLILSVLFLAFGCTHKIKEKESVPADLIAKDQMVAIIVDLKVMDAILALKQRKKDPDLHDTKYYLYNSVMEKYGITRDKFERSMEYYQRDLMVLDEIYEEAITKLSKMKGEEIKSN
jgi:hypothetical protein